MLARVGPAWRPDGKAPKSLSSAHGSRTDRLLAEFFRIARALGKEPAILFIDVITAWRADPTDYRLYKSRVSDFAKLYRLGYHHDPGDFRELPRTCGLLDQATSAEVGLPRTCSPLSHLNNGPTATGASIAFARKVRLQG